MKLFKELGFFNNKTNKEGLVRDHILSRKHGYRFNLPSCIIRHPENLQLLSHSENVKKGFSDKKLTDQEIENLIKQLLTKIENTTKSWKEQDLCLQYITERRLSDETLHYI